MCRGESHSKDSTAGSEEARKLSPGHQLVSAQTPWSLRGEGILDSANSTPLIKPAGQRCSFAPHPLVVSSTDSLKWAVTDAVAVTARPVMK